MKDNGKGMGGVFDSYGSHAIDEAVRTAPGPGMVVAPKIWCFKCKQDKSPKGSTRKHGLVMCADCKPKPKE